jgi:endo-1,3(4)-beta-glucanase
LEESGIVMYPNPTNGKFKIAGSSKDISKIEIYNLLGEKMHSSTTANPKTSVEIDLSAFAKGMYLVKIYAGENYYTGTVIVE